MENKLNQLTFEFLAIPMIAIPSIVLIISAITLMVFSGFDSVTIHWANYSDYQWINIANIIISALLILAAMAVEIKLNKLSKKDEALVAVEGATLSVKELGNAISLAILGFGFFCLYFYLYVESGVITSTDRYVIILSSLIFLAAVSVLFFSLILKRQSEKTRRRHKISAVSAGILSCLTIALLLNPNDTPKLFGGYSPGYIGSDKNQVYTVNLLNPCLNEGVMSAKSPFAYFPITTGTCYYNKHYPKAMEDEQSRRYLFALDGDWLEHYDLYIDIKKGQTGIRDRLRLLISLNAAAYVRLSQPGVDLNSKKVKKLREDFGIDDGATLESLTRPYIDLIESDLSDEALMEKIEDDFPIDSIDSFYTMLLFESKNHSMADIETPSRGYLVKLNSYSKTLNMLEEGPIKSYIMNMGDPL